jgi:hypothetical protein
MLTCSRSKQETCMPILEGPFFIQGKIYWDGKSGCPTKVTKPYAE